MAKPKLDKDKEALCFAYYNKEIGLKLFQAQMKDLGFSDDDIAIYTDGDLDEPEPEQD